MHVILSRISFSIDLIQNIMIHSARCYDCVNCIPIQIKSMSSEVKWESITFPDLQRKIICTHWIIEIEKTLPTLFTASCIKLTATYTECNYKRAPFEYTDTGYNTYKCNKSCTKRFVYMSDPNKQVDIKLFHDKSGGRQCSRNACEECNGTGMRIIKSFHKCDNCDATGGITCKTCVGRFRNAKRIWIGSDYRYVNCDQCKEGYSEMCEKCNGGKAIEHDAHIPETILCKYCH